MNTVQTLLIWRDGLESVDYGVPFRIEVRLTVVGFGPRMQDGPLNRFVTHCIRGPEC
jgi:hypothetical protein